MKSALIVAEPRPGRGDSALFPDEDAPGVSFSQQEILRQSPIYSRFYAALITAVAPALARETGIDPKAAALLARRVLVPVTHCFFDRSLRLETAAVGFDSVAVPSGPPLEFPADIESFHALAGNSVAFNEALLRRLALTYGYNQAPALLQEEPAPLAGGVNHNFDAARRGPSFWIRKAWARLIAAPLSRRIGRHPTLSMAYAVAALKARSFYMRLLRELPLDWPLSTPPRDAQRRERAVAAPLREAGASIEAFGRQLGLSPRLAATAAAEFPAFARDMFPSAFLEGAANNIGRCRDILSPQRSRSLVYSEAGGTRDTLMLAAARSLNLNLICVQHGGHYGYLADYVDAEELEYAVCDRFVSWGWTTLPDNPAFRGLKATPLPSPWLSERAAALKRRHDLKAGDKPFDLLFMSNKLKRFGQTPTGATLSRRDLARPFAQQLRDLVEAAAQRGVSILHKPYDAGTRRRLAKTFTALERLGGKNYELCEALDKGLTPALLNRARLVVWDQPGTGFLECLVCDVPTLVLWTRLYNEEGVWAREDFALLERVGVVHRTIESLLKEAEAFRADPTGWTAQPDRREAIASFRRRYAWAEEGWAEHWTNFLEALS